MSISSDLYHHIKMDFPHLRHQSITCQSQTISCCCSGHIDGLKILWNILKWVWRTLEGTDVTSISVTHEMCYMLIKSLGLWDNCKSSLGEFIVVLIHFLPWNYISTSFPHAKLCKSVEHTDHHLQQKLIHSQPSLHFPDAHRTLWPQMEAGNWGFERAAAKTNIDNGTLDTATSLIHCKLQ